MNRRPDPAPPAGPGPAVAPGSTRGNTSGVDLVEVLDRIEGLPALPAFVTRMLSLVDDPEVSTREIADMVSNDQAMAAAVLRLVNAPFYGLGRRISSIQHAVLLLGLRTVRNLALSAVLVKSFVEPSRDRRFDRVRLWRHTVACAAGARLLSQRLGTSDPEEAFLAGLVHDMGIVILDQFFHDGFRRVADLVVNMGTPLVEAEREVFGRDHAFVGRQLARRWNFPAPVTEAIGCHHQPGRARLDPALTAAVHLADALEASAGPPPAARPGAEVEMAPETGAAAGAVRGGGPGGGTVRAEDQIWCAGDSVASAEAAALPEDPFCAGGPLDPAALETLGVEPDGLEGLRVAIAAERGRMEALVSLLP